MYASMWYMCTYVNVVDLDEQTTVISGLLAGEHDGT